MKSNSKLFNSDSVYSKGNSNSPKPAAPKGNIFQSEDWLSALKASDGNGGSSWLPEGTYDAELLSACEYLAKGEFPVIYFNFEVVEGPYKGWKFTTTFWGNSEKSLEEMAKAIKLMGFDPASIEDPVDLVGGRCRVTIERVKPIYHRATNFEPID